MIMTEQLIDDKNYNQNDAAEGHQNNELVL